MKVTIITNDETILHYDNATRIVEKDKWMLYVYGPADVVLAIIEKSKVVSLITSDEDAGAAS